MTKRSPLYLLLLGLLSMTVSCNDNDNTIDQQTTYRSVAVKSFNIIKDDSVLVNLDSVFFSIDLVERRIYNADSLPKGTKIDRLLLNIGTDLTSKIELIVPLGEEKGDTTINYLTNPKDSVDFSHGPVTMKVTSYDGTYTANYQIKVNVHNAVPDTLCWNKLESGKIPTNLHDLTAVKAVDCDGKSLVFTTSASGKACRAATADIAAGGWTFADITLPAAANPATITVLDKTLFMIAGNTLWQSADEGLTWTSTAVPMTWIYGVAGDQLLGCNTNAARRGVSYPSGTTYDLPAGMPVSNTSSTVTFTTKWSSEGFTVIVGGRKDDGSLSSGTWGWDGYSWTQTDVNSAIPAIEGVSLFKYYTYVTNTDSWVIRKTETLFALGGREADGTVANTIYISTDQGFTWTMAGDLLQLPVSMPHFYGTSIIIKSTLLDINSTIRSASSAWTPVDMPSLPAWYQIETPVATRVSKPVTEWQCPYLYMIGGYGDKGVVVDQMWRGVINRLRFNPRY